MDSSTQFLTWVLNSIGGWPTISVALIAFLASIYAKRVIQNELAEISEKLATVSHELKIRESSYSKHLELILDYYSFFFRHYRLCQNATNQDAIRHSDGNIVKTKEVFLDKLEAYISELNANEGKIRLVLPSNLLRLHNDSLQAFNEFKDVMLQTTYDEKFHIDKREKFANIHSIKDQLESGLRLFLRTEHMLGNAE